MENQITLEEAWKNLNNAVFALETEPHKHNYEKRQAEIDKWNKIIDELEK